MEKKRNKNTIRKVQKENMKRNNINSTGNNNNSIVDISRSFNSDDNRTRWNTK